MHSVRKDAIPWAIAPRIAAKPVLRLNTFVDLEEQLRGFGQYYENIPRPFEWKFTRANLKLLLNHIDRARQLRRRIRARTYARNHLGAFIRRE